MFITTLLQGYQLTHWHVLGAVAALYISGAVVYALLFSPLRGIPGRFITKLSSAYFGYVTVTGCLADACVDDYYKYGDIYTLTPSLVVLSNPSDCKRVLSTYRYPKSDRYFAFGPLGDTIFSTSSADVNRLRRKMIGPAFTHGNLSRMEAVILECGVLSIKKKWDEAIESAAGLGSSATVAYDHHLFLAGFEIISTLAFGQRSHVLDREETELLRWHRDTSMLCMVHFGLPFVSMAPFRFLTRKLWQSLHSIARFSDAATERRRELLRTCQIEKPSDILQTMLDAIDPETKARLTKAEITAENVLLLMAGSDTTSLTMTWTMHYLMLYPDVYRRVVDEVRSAFPHDHLITYAEGRARLPYLEACIYESMRIRGASSLFLPRTVPKGGGTFQGHFIPEGAQVGVSIAGLNHNTDVWDNPRRFIPERFISDETAKQKVMTFSSGVRVCPGRNLAWMEMTTILANVLKDYDLELPANSAFGPDRLDEHGNPVPIPDFNAITVGPKYPHRDCRLVITRTPVY
ncbi:putative cytochrome P450 monooxygenase [Martensiomyces pterosporus]|nr:putative cytochrome P450 monooxygenase [Martensiomyces pterosporus]